MKRRKAALRRKAVVLMSLFLLLMMCVLSACTKGNSASGGGTNASSPAASNAASSSPAASSAASSSPAASPTATADNANHTPVTLKLLCWFVGDDQKVYDLFHKKYPWITIEPLAVGTDGKMMEKQAALQAAGDSADLTWMMDLSGWTKDGLLQDIAPFIKNDPTINSVKVVDGYLDAFKTKDNIYAMPNGKISEWILVNKDMLRKKGLEMPKNDWTYDDLLNLAKKATDPSAGEYGIAYDSLWQGHFKWPLPVANGDAANLYFLNKDLTQSVADTPAVLDDLRWIQQLTTKWHVIPNDDEAKKQGIDPNNAFLSGKSLFTLGADWVLPGMKKANFDWDILPMPKGKVSQVTTQILGPIGVLAASKHKDEAYKFLSWLFTTEAQKQMIDNGSTMFVNDPQLDQYVEQADIWKGKNTAAIVQSMHMCCNLPGANIPDFMENLTTIDNPINTYLRVDDDISKLKPSIEAWNKKTLDVRKTLGW